jgi:hypothetical protein
MKTPLALFFLGVSVVAPLRAQAPATVQYAPGSLEQLVAPIALYPDPLIALILPAATASTDVVLAARYLEQNGDPAQIDAQPWDPSVKSLAHYPDVVTWMDANLAWTQALGQAYSLQPTAVMQAIQTMRAKALAAGTLQSTPQQQVVLANGVIEVVPVQSSSVIYVPSYDWNVVYDTGPFWDYPLVTFRICYPIGPWLRFSCDWRDHRILSRPWRHDWDGRLDGDRWDGHGDRRDRGMAVASHIARPPAAPRIGNATHFGPRPGRATQAPSFTQNQPGRRAVNASPRVGTAPPRIMNAQPRIPNPSPRLTNTSPRMVNTSPRMVNSQPRTPERPRNFPNLGEQRRELRNNPGAFRREPVPFRGPAAGFAQSSPPRSFGGSNGGGRPAFQPSQRPSFQSPTPRVQAAPADRGDSTRRQGRAQR